MRNLLLGFLVGFFVALLIAPLIIWAARKLKFGQNIYHYVEVHKAKQGTPTMGGLIFLLATLLGFFMLRRANSSLAFICLAVFIGYGILGFLDDFLKIRRRANEGGLKPWQKIVGQLLIACVFAVFAYQSSLIGAQIFIPFIRKPINLAWGIIPFIILVFVATTNSVNLTDGLDGLAGGVSVAYLASFAAVLLIEISWEKAAGVSLARLAELNNLLLLTVILTGAITAYLAFNSHPAKIFMGDTGSLAIGGFVAAAAAAARLALFIPLLGAMFVASSVSVIIQVLHYKRTKRRVFLMAPVHHHFEQKGVFETKIVAVYMIITVSIGALVVLGMMYV